MAFCRLDNIYKPFNAGGVMTHLAFFGLGFDFSLVEERASSLILRKWESTQKSSFYREYFPPSGIELLIFLNRETRGS